MTVPGQTVPGQTVGETQARARQDAASIARAPAVPGASAAAPSLGGAIDHAFLSRVYRGSGAIFLTALLLSLTQASLPLSGGIVAGWLLGLGILASWQWVARRAFSPGRPQAGLAGAFLFIKLPVVGALVWVLFTKLAVEPVGFAIGFLIPQLTIALFIASGRARRATAPASTHAEGSREHARLAPRA